MMMGCEYKEMDGEEPECSFLCPSKRDGDDDGALGSLGLKRILFIFDYFYLFLVNFCLMLRLL